MLAATDVIATRGGVRARQFLADAVEHLGVRLLVGVADPAVQLDNREISWSMGLAPGDDVALRRRRPHGLKLRMDEALKTKPQATVKPVTCGFSGRGDRI